MPTLRQPAGAGAARARLDHVAHKRSTRMNDSRVWIGGRLAIACLAGGFGWDGVRDQASVRCVDRPGWTTVKARPANGRRPVMIRYENRATIVRRGGPPGGMGVGVAARAPARPGGGGRWVPAGPLVGFCAGPAGRWPAARASSA